MRIMYVAPRYHTNQAPIVKGWMEEGHPVCFISQFITEQEDYTDLFPIVGGYSKLFEGLVRIYVNIFCGKEKSETKEFNFRTKFGFPPIGAAKKYISGFKPDLVIVRERAVYNIPFVRMCRRRKIPCILYNQSPLWDKPGRDAGWKKKLLLPFFPKKRMTTVMGRKEAGTVKTPNAAFVPFVAEKHYSAEQKTHFKDGKIQILCVGRYEARKNLLLLLDATADLLLRDELHLTIIGESVSQDQREYYGAVCSRIKNYRLEQKVTLHQNFTMDQMYEAYREADLFVLPSTRERASVAQLEAMSCSLPVICSDTNGAACYVEDGVNGCLFLDNDKEDLRRKIMWCVSDKDGLLRMGRNSYELVEKKYQFQNYKNALLELIDG